MKIKALSLLALTTFALSACVSTTGTNNATPNVYSTTQGGQTVNIDVSELGGLQGAFNNALSQAVGELKKPTILTNITNFTTERKTVQGKEYAMLYFHTADDKVYIGRANPADLTQEKIDRFKKVKGATVIGAIPAQGQPNHFVIRDIKYFVY